MLEKLANQGGLLGVSGLSGDIRDLEQAAEEGNASAVLALDHYIAEIRRQLGGLLATLGGADVIVFTGGIGENGKQIRARVCLDLEELGIALDAQRNESASESPEFEISSSASRIKVWVIPTNEELIVARQTRALLRT